MKQRKMSSSYLSGRRAVRIYGPFVPAAAASYEVSTKAIKRFQMKAIVDASSKKDIQEASAYKKEAFHMPKIYIKNYYSVSAAIHSRIVRVRSQTRGDRNIRYTTKLRVKRQGKALEYRTGTFAKPTPMLVN